MLYWVELGVSFGTVAGTIALLGKARTLDEDMIKERGNRLLYRDPAKFDMDRAFLYGGSLVGSLFLADAFQEFVAETRLERFVRGFALGGAVGFAAKGGVQMMWKMINKTLVME